MDRLSIFKIAGNNTSVNIAKYIFVFIPAIVYFILVNKYAVNIPSWDDYDTTLRFLSTYKNAHGIDKFYLLMSQQNEHRIFSSRLVNALYESIMGNINFRALIFSGNLQLLLTFILFISFIKKCLPLNWFIPSLVTGLCLFDISNWENADFALAALQNYGVIFLFLASLFFYSLKNNWYLPVAILLQVICTYSSGNGVVASAVLVAFNLLNKNRLNSYVCILVFLIFSPLYFLHYASIHNSRDMQPVSMITVFFLCFVSHHIYYPGYIISAVTGALILISFIILLPVGKKYRIQENAAIFICIFVFLILSMIMASLFRANSDYMIPSRYLIYPHFLAAILFVLLLVKIKDKKITPLISVLFTLCMLVFYNMNFRGGVKGLTFLKKTLTTTDYYYPDKKAARELADESCRLNIYCIEHERSE